MALTLPATARAAVFHGPGDIRLERVPLNAPGPGEVLVRIRACGLCSGETLDWYMARKAPAALGHEPVAEIVAAGHGVSVRPGARVFVHHHAPCLACAACRRGAYVHCATWRRTRLVPGALAEYALVPREIVAADMLLLPDDMADEAGVFIEPLACVVKSLRRGGFRGGERVLVIGLGVMGLLHVLLARRWGAGMIIGADPLPGRRERAIWTGADAAFPSGPDLADRVREATDEGVDLAVVTPSVPEALAAAADVVAPAGRIVIFTPLPPEVRWPVAVHDLFFREIQLIPSYSAGPEETREALRLIAEGLRVTELITDRLPLERAAEGYALISAGQALKVVVTP